MTMYSTLLALATAAGVLVWLSLMIAYDIYLRSSEPTIVNCPTSGTPAALATSADGGDLRITRCSHWPQLAGCDQSCLHRGRTAHA